ncbi:MAG: rod shape-determining protein MreD [Sporichthyaceae bacterium]|nr:rod shape-determining protein MreD [Sporichthyaceae bacterium]
MTAAPSRLLLAAVLVASALAAQVTLLNRLSLPGATPDLVLLVVVALALALGPTFGLVTGFTAGLALDLVPPADHEIGRWALVLTVIGYLAGLAQAETRRSAFVPLAVVALAAAASVLLYAGLGALMADASVTWVAVSGLLPTAVAYDVVLSAFALPAVLAAVHRVGPESVA